MKAIQWCDCQVKCTEDTEGTFTCAAHIAEGRTFQCPYMNPENRKQAEYPCNDYRKAKEFNNEQ